MLTTSVIGTPVPDLTPAHARMASPHGMRKLAPGVDPKKTPLRAASRDP